MSPLSKIPRKIRDRIYRELLLTDLTSSGTTSDERTWYLETNILRASKQIYNEAKDVLYLEYDCILCTIDKTLCELFVNMRIRVILSEAIERFPGPVVLHMGALHHYLHKRRTTLLTTAGEAHHFCRYLIIAPELYSLEMTLAFSENLNTRPGCSEMLLDAFHDVHSVGSVVITGVYPLSSANTLRKLIKGPPATLEEIEHRAGVFLARGDSLVSKNRYLDAGDNFSNGRLYLDWRVFKAYRDQDKDLKGDQQEDHISQKDRLARLSRTLQLRAAFCKYKLGWVRAA